MSKQLTELMEADAAPVPEDKLDRLRSICAVVRDLRLEITSLEEILRQKNSELSEFEYVKLPELFTKAGVTRIDLDAKGNLPPYVATMSEHYRANIQAEWPEEKREAAFCWLEDRGQGDLIKRTVTIQFGLDEDKLFARVWKALTKFRDLNITLKKTVPWNTLTSFLKELYQAGTHLGTVDLERIGGTVGNKVTLKPAKEK